MSVARFIAAQRTEHRVPHAVACRVLGVSQSWFYKWHRRAVGSGEVSARLARRAELDRAVAAEFWRRRGTYGSPRITAELREAGWRVGVNTVAVSMARQQLVARSKRHRRGNHPIRSGPVARPRPGAAGVHRYQGQPALVR